MSSSHQLFDTHVVYLSSRKKKVQLVDIIIFVDTPISFVVKWDKRPLDGQKKKKRNGHFLYIGGPKDHK